MSPLKELKERRVPQYLALYLGVGWGMIEFLSFLEERYAISPRWTDLALLSWLLLVPSVLLFIWHHGRPGKDELQRSEKIFIPLNLLLGVAVLAAAFSGRELSATTKNVTVTDEHGEAVERTVARAAHRKRVAVYWFDAAPADTAAEWLRIGAPFALYADLLQDPFLDMKPAAQFREQLRIAGAGEGFNVPLALKQKIAQEQHLPYFLAGRVATRPDGYTIAMSLYETATSRLVRQRDASGADLYALIDALAVQLREDLELPAASAAGVTDLPVAELLSPNLEAYRALATSQSALMRGDFAAADRELTRATELDPTFAMAHFTLYQTRSARGNAQGGMPHLARAMQHLYRLPERVQFIVKTENYIMQQDMGKAFAVATMMVELYPTDVLGHLVSAQLFSMRDDKANAINSLRRLVELDPQQQEYMLQIAGLQERQGTHEEALQTYNEYTQKFPRDTRALVKAGRVQQRLGRFDEARASFERATVADPMNIEARVDLATLARSTGSFAEAENGLRAALIAATTAEDSARALGGLQGLYDGTGRVREALAALRQRVALAPRFLAPVQVLATQMGGMGLYVRAGQRQQAEAQLASIRTQFTPPLDQFWQQGALIIAIETRDSTRLKESLAALRRIIDGFGFRFMEPNYLEGTATLHELRGDWPAAAKAYEEARKLDPTDLTILRDIARCYRNLGRLDDALRLIDEHLRAAPYSVESNLEAARIRLARNDAAGARQHLDRVRKALERADPGHAGVAELKQLSAN